MLRQGPLSLTLHAALEPLIAALFIAAPFLFGFSDEGAPTAVSIVIGILVLGVGMSTCWRLSLIKVIPVAAHLMIDLVVAAALVAAPFLLGFSDSSGPTAFMLVTGVGLLLVTLATRWYPARDSSPRRPRRDRGTADAPPA